MATFTITTSDVFPDGTTVGAYPADNIPAGVVVPSGSPTTTAVASGGQVVFTGLADATRYVAYANVGGQNRVRRFLTPSPLLSAARRGEKLATKIGAIGDSITDNGNHGSRPTFNNGQSYLFWAVLYSQGRLLLSQAASTGRLVASTVGLSSTQITQTHLPVALASDWDVVLIEQGTNDLTDQTPGNLATVIANDTACIQQLLAAGKLPVLCTLPPKNQLGAYGLRATNAAKRRLAASYGIPLVDFFGVLREPNSPGCYSGFNATGSTAAGALNIDQTHPNQAGAKLMGQALWNAVSPYVSPHRVPIEVVNKVQPSDTGNLLATNTANGIFLTDTNADGVPDGWTKDTADATADIATASQYNGNLLSLTRGASDASIRNTAAIASTAAGNRMLFALELASTVKATASSYEVYLKSGDSITTIAGFTFMTEDIPAGSILAIEFTVPSGMAVNTLKINPIVRGAAGAKGSIGCPLIMDLTAQGVP